MNGSPIGEIVECAATSFVAECLEVPRHESPRFHDAPPLGSFVRVPLPGAPAPPSVDELERSADDHDPFDFNNIASGRVVSGSAYALVTGSATASVEPGRRPAALGYADESEMAAQQPQLFELLRTEFSALLVGHVPAGTGALCAYPPPVAPRIHSRVFPCAPSEVRALTADLSFLRSILKPSHGAAAGDAPDQVAAACLRLSSAAQPDPDRFLLTAGRGLAVLLADDYPRLRAILRTVR